MPIDFERTISLVFAGAALLCACGGSSSGPPSNELRVAGTYDTQVTLVQNACSGIIVQRNTTTVAHTPGANGFTLTHAGNVYDGNVQRNGTFVTIPKVIGGSSESNTITISGTFTTTAIDAMVTIDVQRAGSVNCRYTVKWAGPKQGGPNVIPGS
jgi:hypothetical protein